ncbi:cation diffusion facilitator family transporter [Halomarina oriensis]|uniref:Cation diffusion facilitator family transporter n=1 Tax=Halomarina oriensis TaxID=671145 RepID=A0A6B0GPA9_9EURY|nr:cation diffusion facilitator family transporter [Halomarina oriensis]MWG35369.1 cation diffusion facilitator family transporter [Halomarina oriensis]
MSIHDHSGGHDDEHGSHQSGSQSTRTLAVVAAINFVGFVVELAGGLAFGSVALISDAFHMLFDMLAYVMAFGASYTAERYEGGERWSYGLHRLEPTAAFLNGALLLPMVGYILWESYQRFLNPVAIDPMLTLVIAVGGLLVNLGSVYILQGGEMSLNERGAFYHLLGDAGGSVAVIVSTVAVAAFDLPIADPIAAVLIGALVLWSAGKVLRESTAILLERSPVPSDEVRTELLALDDVDSIADLHIWQVCSQLTVATVRLTTQSESLTDQRAVQQAVHERLAEWDIDHATVECLDGTAPDVVQSAATDHH